jgi:predicted transcriptional regulator
MTHLSIELPDELAARLRQVAGERDTTPDAVLADLVRWHLQDEAALEAAIAEGEADLAAGRVAAAEDVFRRLRDIVASARRGRGDA